ncbi:MAG: hypothetical protein LWW94_10980 [Candidatus Desulfofervidaceae bacterium]|nr:hypothetical protein [Candidatus Desulfofervidaceae bacterium]
MPKLIPYLPYEYILNTVTHAKSSNDPKSLIISAVIVLIPIVLLFILLWRRKR